MYAVVTDTVTSTRLRKERFEVALKLATFCNTKPSAMVLVLGEYAGRFEINNA